MSVNADGRGGRPKQQSSDSSRGDPIGQRAQGQCVGTAADNSLRGEVAAMGFHMTWKGVPSSSWPIRSCCA